MQTLRLRQEDKASIGTKVMNDGASNHLAERSANADCGADCPEGKVRAAHALCEIGDH